MCHRVAHSAQGGLSVVAGAGGSVGNQDKYDTKRLKRGA